MTRDLPKYGHNTKGQLREGMDARNRFLTPYFAGKFGLRGKLLASCEAAWYAGKSLCVNVSFSKYSDRASEWCENGLPSEKFRTVNAEPFVQY